MTTTEGEDIVKAECLGQTEARGAESSDSSCDKDVIAENVVQGDQCRVVDRRGSVGPRPHLEFTSISKQALKQYLLALGLLSSFWKDSTLETLEADPMLATCSNWVFSKGLEPWIGERALLTQPPMGGGEASVLAQSEKWKRSALSTSEQPRPV